MRKIILAAALAAFVAAPVLAQETGPDISMDTVLGTTIAEVTASLTERGYEVRKSETEDGEMEVYFVGHGKKGEVYVSARTGKPTRVDIE